MLIINELFHFDGVKSLNNKWILRADVIHLWPEALKVVGSLIRFNTIKLFLLNFSLVLYLPALCAVFIFDLFKHYCFLSQERLQAEQKTFLIDVILSSGVMSSFYGVVRKIIMKAYTDKQKPEIGGIFRNRETLTANINVCLPGVF